LVNILLLLLTTDFVVYRKTITDLLQILIFHFLVDDSQHCEWRVKLGSDDFVYFMGKLVVGNVEVNG